MLELEVATPDLAVLNLGRIDYEAAWQLQRELAAERAADRLANTLLLLEHPHTYTFGSKGKREHLLVPEEDLRAEGIAVLDVDRGGDVTYHGPGQLVGYPVLRLRDYGIRCVQYLRCLEEVLVRVAGSYGLTAGRQRGYTGVWVGDAKLAAIGTKVDANGITRHGFALNVTTDLRYFARIIPCGIPDKAVCSLESLLGRPVDLAEAAERTVQAFHEVFDPVGRSQKSEVRGASQ
ncbi:MAG: lipoyl(octanoyl) transferase LipB [Chloroflexota bacterium]|nr:lipoyl(octanoyl) transferase LipB [Chloroflexota bacterium]